MPSANSCFCTEFSAWTVKSCTNKIYCLVKLAIPYIQSFILQQLEKVHISIDKKLLHISFLRISATYKHNQYNHSHLRKLEIQQFPSKQCMHAACMLHGCCMHAVLVACMHACMQYSLHACGKSLHACKKILHACNLEVHACKDACNFSHCKS